ncbi:ribbon-helix-helix DNA binding domain protein [Microbacterium phage Phinky]|nr:ribbon-helix-helix DNA binding domain protein [Microbacterium phage Phinky]
MGGANWRDITKDAVAARAAESVKNSHGSVRNSVSSRVSFSPRVIPFLVRAAERRGISIAGYIRRSVMAHVAMDLGLDPIELFKLDLAIGPTGRGGATKMTNLDLDGARYGQWKVRPDESAGSET